MSTLKLATKPLYFAVALLTTGLLIAWVALLMFTKKNDNMTDLLNNHVRSRLVEVDLMLERGGQKQKKTDIIKITEISSIYYINNHKFGMNKAVEYYYGSSYWPFKASFVFQDGSHYDAIVDVPNKPGYLKIRYPINPWSMDAIDDKVYYLDLESEETKYLKNIFEKLGAYN